jgi:hypothetical protein
MTLQDAALFSVPLLFGLATKVQEYDIAPDGLLTNLIAFNIFVEVGATRSLACRSSTRRSTTWAPAEGVEYKIELPKGGQVQYRWTVSGGVVNYDMHGTPKGGGKESSYKSARGVPGDEGTLAAGFDGTHGWFFRNRGSQPVTITLQTTGAYAEIRKVM